jgi:DNA-binding NtrC family response regulator
MARILVIEDDEQVSTMLYMTLSKAGHHVEEAPDGEIGTNRFFENPFDLVITDIVMPDKEGLATIQDLLGAFPDLKIIAISGGGQLNPMTYLAMATELGAARAFFKPIDQAELLSAVEDLLAEAENIK